MNFARECRLLISYFSFSMATSAVGFIATLAMIRLMPPEEFGRVAFFLTIHSVVAPLISLSSDSLVAINKAKLSLERYEHFRRSYITFVYLTFIVVQILFIFLYVSHILSDYILLLIPLYGLIRFLIGVASTEFIMEEKAVKYGLVSFFTLLLSVFLTILALNIFSGVADWRIASLLIADILFLFVRYYSNFKTLWKISLDVEIVKGILRFGWPLLISVAPAWVLNESDKVIVAKYADMTSLGHYAAACSIGGIIITFNIAVLNALTPKLYAELTGNCSLTILKTIKHYSMKFLGATIVFGIFFLAVYSFTFDWILPVKYLEAHKVVYVVTLFLMARGIYSVLGLVTDYYGMTMAKLEGLFYGALTSAILALLGIIEWGVIGVAVGVGFGYLVLSATLWLRLAKKFKSL